MPELNMQQPSVQCDDDTGSHRSAVGTGPARGLQAAQALLH